MDEKAFWRQIHKEYCSREYLFASVVKRYALTQPQRHRGTEAIFSA
ncbi:hypothetical protein [Methanothrix soehngenii]|nr:hypothetical protein [Methanothrix soehngenii]